jgi:hypothetical protein
MRTLIEWVKARQTAYDAYHELADETDARKIAAYIKHNTGTDINNDIEWDDLDKFWLDKIADAANPPGGQFSATTTVALADRCCGNCFAYKPQHATTRLGECRLMPPTVTDFETGAEWPAITEREWCAKWDSSQ